MDNSINFKGAFLIYKPTPEVKQALLPVLGRKKNIFNNFMNRGDSLYVVKDDTDKRIANVIATIQDIQFKYFPNLNIKPGFETKNHKKLIRIIKDYKDEIITTKDKLLSKVKKNPKLKNTNINRTQEKNIKLIQKETAIDFSDGKYIKSVNSDNGVCTIKALVKDDNGDTEKRTVLRISPPGKFGICYAEYIPLNAKNVTRRIAINKNGKKIFEYDNSPSEILRDSTAKQNSAPSTFDYNFNAAKKYYKEQMVKKLNAVA